MEQPTPCRHLRTKKMYVPAQEEAAFSDKFDPNSFNHCWCNRTMTEIGEDDRLVSFRGCTNPQRRCFRG
ncbi:MAG TPA: hypothetical protein VG095_07320, partial [Chthoniobacterales bacterium]|nr:hypothetical protein [Chthoniobacterales bacterium]